MTRCLVSTDTDSCEEPDPHAAGEWRPVLGLTCETGADDDVRAAVVDRREQLRELRSNVLAVAVEPDREVEALLLRELEPRLHGASDPEVERKRDDACAGRAGAGCRAIGGAVVDDNHFEGRVERTDVAHDPADGIRFVAGGHDRDRPTGGHAAKVWPGLRRVRR